MVIGLGLEAPQCLQWVASEGIDSEVSTHRHPDGTDGTRSKHGTLARRQYVLLVPTEPAGDLATTESQDCGDGPEATLGTGGPDERATETENQDGQRIILVCGQTEESDV